MDADAPARQPLEPALPARELWERIRSRALLVLVLTLVGLAAGYTIALGRSPMFEAKEVLYLAPPLGGSGQPLQALASEPAALAAIVHSDAVLARVARETHLSLAELQNGVSGASVGGAPTAAGSLPPRAFVITVSAPRRAAARRAATLLGDLVLAQSTGHRTDALRSLEREAARNRALAAELDQRLHALSGSATDPVRAGLVGLILQERGQILQQQSRLNTELAAVRDVERSRVLSSSTIGNPHSHIAAGVVGALIAFILAVTGAALVPAGVTAPASRPAALPVSSAAGDDWIALAGVGLAAAVIAAGLLAIEGTIGRAALLAVVGLAIAGGAAVAATGGDGGRLRRR